MSGWNPRTLHMSSKYANITYDANMTKVGFQLNRPLTVPESYELHISVLSACIPYSFYGIPNPVPFIANGTSYTLPAGNWSATDIATKLSTAWNAFMTVTFVSQTGLFNFKNNTGTAVVITHSATSPLLGLSTTLDTSVPANSSVNSSYFPDIFGTRFVNIVSSLNTDCITAGTVTSGSGALLSIPVNTSPNGFIVYTPNNLVRHKLKETSISNFDITLCDSNMQPLNMNGCSWEIDLLAECVIPVGENQIYSDAPNGMDLFSSVKGYHPRKLN